MAAPPVPAHVHPEFVIDRPELRTLLICPQFRLAAEFISQLRRYDGVSLVHTCTELPSSGELARVARIHAPTLVVLSVEDPDAAAALLDDIQKALPDIPVAALHTSCEPELLLKVMRLGVQEIFSMPFRPDYVSVSFERLRERVRNLPELPGGTDHVYSFMPAKQGAGATTIALNTAAAAASVSGKQVFLADFDLSAGILRFVLQLNASSSVVNAALALEDPQENVWPKFISQSNGIHVLHSGRLQPGIRVEPWQVRRLVEQIRLTHDVVCADLSGNFEAYSLEIMRQSQKIFVVATPELPSLYLAREKIQFLRQLYLGDRLRLILNRTLKRGLSMADVASIVEVPVAASFPNDYATVSKAIENAGPVKPGSELGRHYAEFAKTVVAATADTGRRPVRRFLEFFSVPTAGPAA